MSLQSITGNIGYGTLNVADIIGTYAKGGLANVFGTVKTGLGSIWSGGFAGISKEEVENTLIPAIENYCEKIETEIASFDATADLTQTFAGTEMQGAAQEFVTAVKELLQAYVSTMRAEIARVNQAYEQWETGSKNVASNVSSNASNIRSNADNIKLD